MKKNITLLLLGIVLLATVLRLWGLGSVPPSPDWDEAALGYNAYSILQTGKDEYGEPFPFILRSFGDYKPAMYTYLAIPSVAIFGLDTFAVRLPSALFGIVTVIAVFFLVKEISKRDDLALVSALLLAISPWHIQFSRVAFETNIGVSLSVIAALFFLYGLRRHIFLFASALCLGLGFYAYQSEKVFVPLFGLLLVALFFKQLLKINRFILLGVVLFGLLISLPMITSIFGNSTTLERAKNVSVFNPYSDDFKLNTEKLIVDHETNDIVGLVLDNRRVLFGKLIIENYLSHFDLNWLFITGDIPRHHAPGMGLLYFIELPILLIGIYALLFGNYPRIMKLLLFGWILLAPIPASLSTGVPHAVRTFHMVPVITILTAIGLLESVRLIRSCMTLRKVSPAKNKSLASRVVLTVFGAIYAINFAYYLNQYFVQQPYFFSRDWQYGYQQAVEETKKLEGQYDKIVVSNKGYLDQSYIFYLFYLKFSPNEYQSQMRFINNGQTDRSFGKYEFRPIDWPKDKDIKNVLYVGMPGEFPVEVSKKATVHFLDNTPAITLVGTEE